ncbi:MAG TPA: hypothetical protein VFH60_07225, partial [Chloroflexia bacterium]|nr:hypothetical protein [Chloroflexia bacterium]
MGNVIIARSWRSYKQVVRSFLYRVYYILFRAGPPGERLCLYQGFYYLLRNWLRRHGNRGLLARSRTWPHVKISLFFFGVLFVIPGICNLINGTLLSKNVQTSTVGTPVRVLGFLEDWGIVLIATVLWPAHAAVMYGVLTRVSNALRDLTRSKILLINASDYSKFVRNYNDWANAGWLAFGIILVSAIYTGYVYASRQGAWWGQLQYGLLGFMAYLWLTFITIHQIVMYVCKGLAGVLLTWDVLTRRRVVLDLQPYHQDGVHGIAELGRIQFLIWVGNFILTIFLFVLPASGVVELKPGFILLFAVVYLIILPVVAYFPVR